MLNQERNVGGEVDQECPDRSLLVFSAHFDDALLSAAGLIKERPGTTVVTVFGGAPSPGVPSHPWDRATGRAMACEAVEVRAREDREALELVGACQQRLGFYDQPYRTGRLIHEDPNITGPLESALVPHIGRLIDDIRPCQVLLPLGHPKWHPDHHATSEATIAALRTRRWCEPIVYVDLPYGLATPRLARSRQREFRLRGLHVDDYLERTDLSAAVKKGVLFVRSVAIDNTTEIPSCLSPITNDEGGELLPLGDGLIRGETIWATPAWNLYAGGDDRQHVMNEVTVIVPTRNQSAVSAPDTAVDN